MYIYGLFSPEGELRYIGKTVKPIRARFLEHIRPSCLDRETSYKNNWIKGLIKAGNLPYAQEIQQVASEKDLQAAEMYWISFFRNNGCNLVNGTDGGEGCSGRVLSESQKRSVSLAQTGRKKTVREIELNILNQPNRKPITDSLGRTYRSIAAASKQLGIDKHHIGKVVSGKRKTAGGLRFTRIG